MICERNVQKEFNKNKLREGNKTNGGEREISGTLNNELDRADFSRPLQH